MTNKLKTRTPLLALILFIFSIGYAVAEKVVVVPLGADTAQWALIKGSNSTIIRQSGGISVTSSSTAGIYYVNFGRDIRGHAISAMLQSGSYDKTITAGICGNDGTSETVGCGTSYTTSTLIVHVRNSQSSGWSHGTFYVAVLP